ncbi:hypothetical protein BR93DRAFT_311333 [Coniochaeta sp. PMI_546]|nr:hypothetical protein BR93DRAFT_311333 [Coniochaeta sp. PMI_546]
MLLFSLRFFNRKARDILSMATWSLASSVRAVLSRLESLQRRRGDRQKCPFPALLSPVAVLQGTDRRFSWGSGNGT